MEEYISAMKENTPDSSFFKAILALHNGLYEEAKNQIKNTRYLLDTEIVALMGESYDRAYSVIVRIQMLVELEEIIKYKNDFSQGNIQKLKNIWKERIKGNQRSVEVWQRILKVRNLILDPKDDLQEWIKFANLGFFK